MKSVTKNSISIGNILIIIFPEKQKEQIVSTIQITRLLIGVLSVMFTNYQKQKHFQNVFKFN